MKPIYTTLLSLLSYFASNATTWEVSVGDFQFSPATVNAVVGDIIQFNWTAGIHTTTCGSALTGTSLPSGAAEWDSEITATNPSFSYTLTVAGTYNYGCTPHFAFGMDGTLTVSGTVPVLLGLFNVNFVKNTGVLEWKTLAESNTDYFSVRKSSDGINFNEIGKINAAGNSSKSLSYRFIDNDLGKKYKYLYYEIVIVDIDKKESASPIKTLRNNNIIRDLLIVSVSPNPITRPGQLQLQFNSDANGQMNVSVFSMSGQKVLQTKMAAFYGLNSGHLHICDLNKGTYNVIFQLADKKETRKVVVL